MDIDPILDFFPHDQLIMGQLEQSIWLKPDIGEIAAIAPLSYLIIRRYGD